MLGILLGLMGVSFFKSGKTPINADFRSDDDTDDAYSMNLEILHFQICPDGEMLRAVSLSTKTSPPPRLFVDKESFEAEGNSREEGY